MRTKNIQKTALFSPSSIQQTAGQVNTSADGDEFWELLQSSLIQFEEGDIIKGTVVAIDSEGVLVDIGFKSEGIVPLSQFKKLPNGELEVKIGDVIEVSVYKKETENGLVLLSKQLADRVRGWSTLTEAYKKQENITGTPVSATRAGLIVDLGDNITGFIPISQLGLNPGEKIDSLLQKPVKVKILDLDIQKGRVILSRRAVIEEERIQKRQSAFATIHEGDIVKGKVKAITPYGAFIDLGGLDGLLHI
ncbi:MAG: S1 RNA-binding domain-containing protein, partial [bacterium]|nr:S1 RNA-binding domain-containing protein [bacterium]